MSYKKVIVNIGTKCCSTYIHHPPPCKTQIFGSTGLKRIQLLSIFARIHFVYQLQIYLHTKYDILKIIIM